MAEENQAGFKVTDRRSFNSDGTLREDAPVEQPGAGSTPAASQPAVYATSAEPVPDIPATLDLHEDAQDGMPEQTLFTEFLMGIASSAFVYLGLVEHPATGKRHVDLNAAKESIDMLVMLRTKTRGNLTRGEEKFFDDLLDDLRMQFVSLRR